MFTSLALSYPLLDMSLLWQVTELECFTKIKVCKLFETLKQLNIAESIIHRPVK